MKTKSKLYILIILIIGLTGFIYSFSLEPFHDTLAIDTLNRKAIGMNGYELDEWYKTYKIERGKLETMKNKYFDWGLVLIIISTLFYFIGNRLSNSKGQIKIPKKSTIYLNTAFGILGLAGSISFHLYLKLIRHDFPWFADSIFISIYYIGILSIILCPLIILYIFLKTYHREKIISELHYSKFIDSTQQYIFCFIITLIQLPLLYNGYYLTIPFMFLFTYSLCSLKFYGIKKDNQN